jgi:transcriptional regulator with XRE-family HTH domain
MGSLMDKLNERLRSLRLERGLLQVDIAKKLNIKRQSISSWEKGETRPSHANLVTLADFYGVTLDYLNGREGSETFIDDKLTQKFFLAALKAYTEKTDWDVTRLSRATNIRFTIMEKILEGEIVCPEKIKHKIVKVFQVPYDQFLKTGKDILDGKDISTWSALPELPDWLLPCHEKLKYLDKSSQKTIVALVNTLSQYQQHD